MEHPEGGMVAAQEILPGLQYVQSVVRLEDGIILIHDLEGFLSLEEETALDRALAESQPSDGSIS
jgi:purine-binding chemotaxis protein CheW